jgi:hypothetical protein
MKREHCEAVDSQLAFAPSNYQVRTTSEVEWHFVQSPEGRLGKELPEGLAVDVRAARAEPALLIGRAAC